MLIFFKSFLIINFLAVMVSAVCFVFGTILLKLQRLPSSDFPWLIYFLPLISLLLYWGRQKFFFLQIKTTTFLREAIPVGQLRWQFFGITILTWISHFFGASVGRESTALQIGGSLGSWFKGEDFRKSTVQLSEHEFRFLGMIMGFSALFGTPLAAVFFVLEITKKWSLSLFLWGLYSSWLSYAIIEAIGGSALHLDLQIKVPASFSLSILFALLVLALACGLLSWFFLKSHRWLGEKNRSLLITTIASFMLILCFTFCDQQKLTGLSLEAFASSYQTESPFWFFVQKTAVTLLSHGAGFFGGEITPIFAIGSNLGSSLAGFWGHPVDLFAAAGMIALFAGIARAPLASLFIGFEVFGITHSWVFILVILISLRIAPRQGLYSLS